MSSLNYSGHSVLINIWLDNGPCFRDRWWGECIGDMVTLTRNPTSGGLCPIITQAIRSEASLSTAEGTAPSLLPVALLRPTDVLRIVKEDWTRGSNQPDGPGTLDASRLYTVFQARNPSSTHPGFQPSAWIERPLVVWLSFCNTKSSLLGIIWNTWWGDRTHHMSDLSLIKSFIASFVVFLEVLFRNVSSYLLRLWCFLTDLD